MIDDIALPTPRKRHALALFEGLPSSYDRMGALLSFGQDPRWRHELVRLIDPQPGARILDVAAGTGLVTEALARHSRCEIVALDQSGPMLAAARARLDRHPELAERVTLVRGEAEQLPFEDGEFDALTFTYLLRYVDDRPATMRELARVVKPGGRIGMVEFGVPARPGCARCGACKRASRCRSWAASSPRRGRRSAAFWGPTSSSSTPTSRTCPDCGRGPGSPTWRSSG